MPDHKPSHTDPSFKRDSSAPRSREFPPEVRRRPFPAELSPEVLAHLEIIYDAYDRIYDIASHRWNYDGFYHHPSQTSGLLGHYVRRLDAFKDRDPALITFAEYATHSLPLQTAMDAIIPLVLGHRTPPVTIRDITTGYTSDYRHLTPYHRVMAIFHLIEKGFPRATYRASAKTATKRRKPSSSSHQAYVNRRPSISSRKTRTTWLPYKD